MIDRKVASQGHLRVGDRTGMLTPGRIEVKIVGIAKFGSQDAFGGESFTAFTLADAQRFIAKSSDKISSIAVKADPGVSQDQLRRQIQAVLPPGGQAITGQALVQENLSITNKGFLNVFRIFLLTFAAVALLVGIFSIYNTFSIIVAQRARESALLRTIGASQGQVLTSVVVEGFAIALIASIAGLAGGLTIGILLTGLFSNGFGVPISGLVFTLATGMISVAVGVVVTLLACLLPAARASRVPPLAALRDATVESRGIPRLGLLRAVGATRRQIRMMVRWESLIVALFGTLAGVVVGLFAGWGLATAVSQGGVSQFAVLIVPLLIIVVGGAIAGVVAAIRPASRAARLNILESIATE